MRVSFINTWDALPNGYNIGLLYLISAIKTKHEIGLIDLHYLSPKNHLDFVLNEIHRNNSAVIGFSVTSFTYKRALYLADIIRKKFPSIKLIYGGVHPTILPEDTIQHRLVDAICVGEGEEALLEYLDCLDTGRRPNVAGIWYKDNNGKIVTNEFRPFRQNIDSIIFPSKDCLDIRKYLTFSSMHLNSLPFLSSRGCPYRCSYCDVPVIGMKIKGKYYRVRSVENIISEIESDLISFKKQGFSNVAFQDDTFGLEMDWFEQFARTFIKKGLNKYLTWSCQTRVDIASSDWIKLAAESGCVGVCLGVETGNEEFRFKHYKKYITNREIISAIGDFKRNKILTIVAVLVTPELENINCFQDTYSIIKKSKPHFCLRHSYVKIPKTELTEYLERNSKNLPSNSLAREKNFVSRICQIKMNILIWILRFYYLVSMGFNLSIFKKITNKNMLRLLIHRIPNRNYSIAELLFRIHILNAEIIRK